MVLKNAEASGTHSAAHEPTKFREWAEHGTYMARELCLTIRACNPVYAPDMLFALSYDCPLQLFRSIPKFSKNERTASSMFSDLWPTFGRKRKNRSTGLPSFTYLKTNDN